MQSLAEFAQTMASGHPYLLANLTGLPLLLVVVALSHSDRSVIVAGLILVPFAPLATFHEAQYWSPQRLGDVEWGIEDALYLFISGSFSCGVASLFAAVPRIETASLTTALQRIVKLSLLGAGGWLVLFGLGLGSFEANCLIAGIAVIIGTAMRPRRAVPAVSAGLASTLFHLCNISIAMAIVPAFGQEFAAGAVQSIFWHEGLFQFLFATAHVLFFSWAIESGNHPQEVGL